MIKQQEHSEESSVLASNSIESARSGQRYGRRWYCAGVLALLASLLVAQNVTGESVHVHGAVTSEAQNTWKASVQGQQLKARAQQTGSISGTVSLMNRRGTRPARSVSAEDVLVFFTPDARPSNSQAKAPPATSAGGPGPVMETRDKEFLPRLLAVEKGKPVDFPNYDQILHNVFSVSGKNRFDLDLVGPGESGSKAFQHPGLVRIFCNVHRDMVAHIWVLEGAISTSPNGAGNFRLDNLPVGSGKLTVWHERAEPLEVPVTVSAGPAGRDLELLITRPRIPSHSRKDGSSYRVRKTYN